jgi:hypothetical protein
MKTQNLSSPRRHPRRIAVLAILGLAGLPGIIVVATTLCERSQTKDAVAAPPVAQSAATARRPPGFWYVRMGLWRADARTAVATVRYLLERETQNKPSGRFRSFELAAPTNSASVLPKV